MKLDKEDVRRLQMLKDIMQRNLKTQEDLIILTLEYLKNRYGFNPLESEADNDK